MGTVLMLVAVLHKKQKNLARILASWDQGPKVTSAFDDPSTAKLARETLDQIKRIK